MKRLLVLPVLLLTLLVGNLFTWNALSQTVDFAVQVNPIIGDLSITINPIIGDESWVVLGGCSRNQPNLTVTINPIIGDKSITINPIVGDKTVCITNPEDLDEETLELLGLK